MYHAASGSAFSALAATAIVFASISTLLVASVVAALLGADPLLATLGLLGLVAIPLVGMRVTDRNIAALGIRRPGLRFVVAGVLVGVSAWYINMRVVELLPFDEGQLDGLGELVERPSLAAVLLAIALVPAVCEEILFRGVLTRGLATRFHPWVAIAASAALFAIYHILPIRYLPMFSLGLVFGVIALRSGSAIPTMIAHLLNNTVALLVARREPAALASWLEHHTIAALVIALALTAAGMAIALVGPTDPLPSNLSVPVRPRSLS